MIFRLHLTSGGYADIDTDVREDLRDVDSDLLILRMIEIVNDGGWVTVRETGQMINLQYVTHVEPLPALVSVPVSDDKPIVDTEAPFVDASGRGWFRCEDGNFSAVGLMEVGDMTREQIEESWGPLKFRPERFPDGTAFLDEDYEPWFPRPDGGFSFGRDGGLWALEGIERSYGPLIYPAN